MESNSSPPNDGADAGPADTHESASTAAATTTNNNDDEAAAPPTEQEEQEQPAPSSGGGKRGEPEVSPAKPAPAPAPTNGDVVGAGDEDEEAESNAREQADDLAEPSPWRRRMQVIDANDQDRVRFQRSNSLFDVDTALLAASAGDALLASVITGKTVSEIKKGTLTATYYDGTLIAGAARRKRVLDDSTFTATAPDPQQGSFQIAAIEGGDTPDDELQPEKFGTWDGVWARCMANIFGVIMFLRTGWVVGQAGIGLACAIILLSGFITTLTTMSMAAIATNGNVKGGGAYFLISRSVGPSLGGAIGVLFTLGLTLGVALYTIGFCETMVSQFGVPASESTCLTCYGAEGPFDTTSAEYIAACVESNNTDCSAVFPGEEIACCNSCDAVKLAYNLRFWEADTNDFVQCSGAPIVIAETPELIFQWPGVPDYVNNVRIWGVIVNFVLLVMILIGIGWIVRLQAFFLVLIIISMVSVIIGAAVGPESIAHSFNPSQALAPGFTGLGYTNGTCANATTIATPTGVCNDYPGWKFEFDGTSLNCTDTALHQVCNSSSSSIIGTFNETSCTTAQVACCDCKDAEGQGGGGIEEFSFTDFCNQWLTNFEANLGPGFSCDGPSENFYDGTPGTCWSFFSVFAIFFPAVTGIMAGANISNLLQKPEVNLPVGTFHSVLWSTIGYILLSIVVGGAATRDELIGNYFVMQYMELTPFLIPVGVYCATFSSALASMVGAPQLLMAVAADKLMPFLNVFATTHHRVGFCPSRSRRTGRSVFCFRKAPYVTDGLHVYFARRLRLYLFRHVLARHAELSGAERRVLAAIDSEELTHTDALVDYITDLRGSAGCTSLHTVDLKMKPAKLKAALLDFLVNPNRLPKPLREQVEALQAHLDVNLAHYDSKRCSDSEVRRLLPKREAGAPPLKRIVNSAFVPAEMVKLSLEAFMRRVRDGAGDDGAGDGDRAGGSGPGVELAPVGEGDAVAAAAAGGGGGGGDPAAAKFADMARAMEEADEPPQIHSMAELDGVDFDAGAWATLDPVNCVRTITGEDEYDGLLPVQYGFRLIEGDPVIGYFTVFIVGTGCVLIGTLNIVAPLISMFFLITYGMVNFACALQVWSKNPGWRPAYKFYHWSASLLGGLLCLAAMLIMEWISSIIAILLAIVIAVAIYATPHADEVGNWGDASEAAKHMAIRRNLLGLRTSKHHPKNFRPSYLMVLPEHPHPNHRNIARMAYTLRKGFGTTHIGVVHITDDPHPNLFARQHADNAGFFKMFDEDLRRKQVVEAEVARRTGLATTPASPASPRPAATGPAAAGGTATGHGRAHARPNHAVDSADAVATAAAVPVPSATLSTAAAPSPDLNEETVGAVREQVEKEVDRKHRSCVRWMHRCRRSDDRMWAMMDHVNASDFRTGAAQLMQISGVGPLRPNTLLVELEQVRGLPLADAQRVAERQFHVIQDALRMRLGVVLARFNGHDINFFNSKQEPHRRHGCDAWWVMDDGGFSLIVPHLLMQAHYWKTVTNDCDVKTRYCAVNNAALSGAMDARQRHEEMLKSFRLEWPVEVLPLERRDGARVLTAVEEVAGDVIAEYNAIPYAENLEAQQIGDDERQIMLRWLAVAAVMRAESDDAHVVCGTLPFPRQWMKPCNYMALIQVLSAIKDKNGNLVPVFMSRGNGVKVMTKEFQ